MNRLSNKSAEPSLNFSSKKESTGTGTVDSSLDQIPPEDIDAEIRMLEEK